MQSSHPLVLQYDVDSALEYEEFRAAVLRGDMGRQLVHLTVAGSFALWLAVVVASFALQLPYFAFLAFLLAGSLLVRYGSPWRMVVSLAFRGAGVGTTRPPLGARRLLLGSDTIECEWQHGRLSVTWPGVEAVSEEPWGVSILLLGMPPLAIPNRAFAGTTLRRDFLDRALFEFRRSRGGGSISSERDVLTYGRGTDRDRS